MNNEINKEYFVWMYNLVCNDKYYTKLSYHKLLYSLYNTDFTYTIARDKNRADDGRELRYRFGYDNGYSKDEIARALDTVPCSVLEMMIALSFDIEENIMDDPMYGNRIGQWFWNMIVSLGLGSMSDDKFDDGYFQFVMNRFLCRDYEPNGQGGLFTIYNNRIDLRNVEIWYQAMWYLDDFLENE